VSRTLTSVGFIQGALLFAVLFGLTDHEVFLLRCMQEKWVAKHDNDKAVVSGIAHTARPILSAAATTATVFRMAVILDATVARLLLVPSITTRPTGGYAKSLDRLLPTSEGDHQGQ
jgi:RND superfamily putative drug exporter